MLPLVLRPARFNTPVAELIIDGLALCCFSGGTGEWQVAFVRPAHRLKIEVRLKTLSDVVVQTLTPFEVPMNLKDVRFTVGNPSNAHFRAFPEGFYKATPDFPPEERMTRGNDYDYRWVIDFDSEVPHGRVRRVFKESERPGMLPVTIVRIPNALFYTADVSRHSVVLAPIPKAPANPESFPFGRTNKEVGAGVYATRTADGQIGLVDRHGRDVPGAPFPLPYVADHLYEISILNMDVQSKIAADPKRLVGGDYVLGDLHFYYDLMEVDGPKHYLYARREPRAIDGDCHPLTLDGDCHPVGAGHNGGSVTGLDRLLEP